MHFKITLRVFSKQETTNNLMNQVYIYTHKLMLIKKEHTEWFKPMLVMQQNTTNAMLFDASALMHPCSPKALS